MIAQFHQALSYLHIPVVWTDGVANYGLPFGIIAHPLPNYLGGLISFVTRDPVLSYKLLWLLFSFLTTGGMYRLIRRFTSVWPAVAGAILYTFTAYHILNLYVRGALPEFAAASWLPFLLFSLFEEQDRPGRLHSVFILSCWYTLIFFTHPMFILFSLLVTGLFLVFYRPSKMYWLIVAASVLTALMINAFYILPLQGELKYFYVGREHNLLAPGSGLGWGNFSTEEWENTCSNGDSPLFRCNRIQTGLPEAILMAIAPVIYFLLRQKKRKKIMLFMIFSSVVLTGMLLSFVEPVYRAIPLLGSIQFIYRMLTVWTLLPPLVLALALESLTRYKKIVIGVCIISILALRVPQLYGKNVTNPPRSSYYSTKENVYSVTMSTVWMGESESYKKQPSKGAVVAGKGTVSMVNITPTVHRYTVDLKTDAVFADYTFYFPGWKAFIDNREVPIQWQDPAHRGYITFPVPAGRHEVRTVFTDTKVRLLGKIISGIGLIGYAVLGVWVYMKQKTQGG